ncbi:hypothetical protein K502DRAFT_347117 [Neoconidiobolus thromboides FSU 785]|nr:hypothetical protein K502DRAFT_347117 [Neoconidiobolus thromboides FSU 785]
MNVNPSFYIDPSDINLTNKVNAKNKFYELPTQAQNSVIEINECQSYQASHYTHECSINVVQNNGDNNYNQIMYNLDAAIVSTHLPHSNSYIRNSNLEFEIIISIENIIIKSDYITTSVKLLGSIVILILYWNSPCDSAETHFILIHLLWIIIYLPVMLMYTFNKKSLTRLTGFYFSRLKTLYLLLNIFCFILFLSAHYILLFPTDCKPITLTLVYFISCLLAIRYLMSILSLSSYFLKRWLLVRSPLVTQLHKVKQQSKNIRSLINTIPKYIYDQTISTAIEIEHFYDNSNNRLNSSWNLLHKFQCKFKVIVCKLQRLITYNLFVSKSTKLKMKPNIEKECACLPILRMNKMDAFCSICLIEYNDGDVLRKVACNHHYHLECIDQWLPRNQTCPQCRYELIFV